MHSTTKPFTFKLLASTATLALMLTLAPAGFNLDTLSFDNSAYAKNNGNGGGKGGGNNSGGNNGGGNSGGGNSGGGNNHSDNDNGGDSSGDGNGKTKNTLGKLNAAHASATGLSNASSNSTVGAIAEGNAEEIANKPITDSVLDALARLLDGKEIIRDDGESEEGDENANGDEGTGDDTEGGEIIVTEGEGTPEG